MYNKTELLENEISQLTESLSELDVTSEEYKATLEAIDELTKQYSTLTKVDNETIISKKKDRTQLVLGLLGVGATLLSCLVTNSVKVWGTKVTANLERDYGSITTSSGREFVRELFK